MAVPVFQILRGSVQNFLLIRAESTVEVDTVVKFQLKILSVLQKNNSSTDIQYTTKQLKSHLRPHSLAILGVPRMQTAKICI